MRSYSFLATQLLLALLLCTCASAPKNVSAQVTNDAQDPHYLAPRQPLQASAYLPLPLGTIKPEGWLEDNLRRMANGMTGNLDKLYPEVVGERNGWLGGDGDGWERGPYWIDGLLPLAYLLDDEKLKAKAQRWVDWTLDNQREDGYIGPIPFTEDPGYEPGLQRTQRQDWWPKMVMLKILQQYHGATGDARVVDVLTKYFKYQLRELPNRPLDADTFWGNRRGGDNIQVVQWLYNLTGDRELLDLLVILDDQTFPWDEVFANDQNGYRQTRPGGFVGGNYPYDSARIAQVTLADQGSIHTVNLAQGLKQPALLYQNTGDKGYLRALDKALVDLRKFHGQVQGMYGGDEPLHGSDPTHGIEFCAISEKMFSLETIVQITGDVKVADLLERIAYNALPTQANDDFSGRQYFQSANQVQLQTYVGRSFEMNNHHGTDYVYGIKTGYPCCTTNMHQSWPKFVQNLFYATPDRGVAAMQYGPASASLKVADGRQLTVTEKTGFPFRNDVTFTLALDGPATFPFHVRVPGWTENARVLVNGVEALTPVQGSVAIVTREWKDGDVLTLDLPMPLKTSTWHEFTQAVERGPLVYALGVKGREVAQDDERYGSYTEILPVEDWNYGLISQELDNLNDNITVEERAWDGGYPWNLAAAPVVLKLKGIKIPEWKADNGMPHLPSFWGNYSNYDKENIGEITLVPYGATELRISSFPVYILNDYRK